MKKVLISFILMISATELALASPPNLNLTGSVDGSGLECGATTSEDGNNLRFTYEHENGVRYQVDLSWNEGEQVWTYESKLQGSGMMFTYTPAESCFVAVTPIVGENNEINALKYEATNKVQATACSIFPLPWFNAETYSAICRGN